MAGKIVSKLHVRLMAGKKAGNMLVTEATAATGRGRARARARARKKLS
jgi:hypothetical protein